jgi:hypothetical protein
MSANLSKSLPTCFVKCCLTLQGSCSQTKSCLSPALSNCLLKDEYCPKEFSCSLCFQVPLIPCAPFLSNQSQRLWTWTHPSRSGAEREKNWANSMLSVLCLSDYGLWLHTSAEVKLFFLPCWVTPACFFDHCLGMAFLTVVLGFEFRASPMVGRCSTTWATRPAVLILLIIFFCLSKPTNFAISKKFVFRE